MDAELQFHLESQISDYINQGLSREEAELRARREFGAVELAKDECRDIKPMLWLDHLWRDVRYACRSLRKSSGFTAAAIVTLALGIGANTAIFSVIDGVLLHPIPFPEPDRLVVLSQRTPRSERDAVSYLNLLDWQRLSQTFEAIAGQSDESLTLTVRGQSEAQPEAVTGEKVSANFFSVLRVQPLRGRMFTKEEDQRGAKPVVLLGEDFWKRRFSADPKILGQRLILNGREHTVIGVVPATVRMVRSHNSFANDIFVPIGQTDEPFFYKRGIGNNTEGLGRLKPGVTLAQAQAEMSAIMRNLAKAYPDDDGATDANLISFQRDMTVDLEPALLALAAAVGFVLLIACTNIASLALARSTSRSQEFAVRTALGAGRGRLMRQLLTESAVLSIGAGALGLLIAAWSTHAALSVLPSALPPLSSVTINARVLIFSFVVSALTGILFGLAPALKAAGMGLQPSLRQGGRGMIRGRYHLQHALIVAEVALTLVLLVGAGLMIRSLQILWNVNPGFDPQGLLTFYTGLSGQHTASPEAIRASIREVHDRLAAIPGVEAASVEIGGLPFRGNSTAGFLSENDPQTPTLHDMRRANFYVVGPGHFATMGIPVLRGRSFTLHDSVDSPLVVIIDEELARRVFPGQDPIGKHIRAGIFDLRPTEVIGVAGHVKHAGLDADATATERSQFYFSYLQLPDSFLPFAAKYLTGIVRSKAAPATLMGSIRKELGAFETGRAVHNEELMTDTIAASLAKRRFSLIVLGAFAAMALVLSLVGIYGVISYFVRQRTSEIGLRIALGAQGRDILSDVLGDGGKVGAVGVVLGLAGSAVLARLMTKLLFGISPIDAITFVSAAVLLFALTLVACYIPARKASRIDPMVALRHE